MLGSHVLKEMKKLVAELEAEVARTEAENAAAEALPTKPGAYDAANWSSVITLNKHGGWTDDYGNKVFVTEHGLRYSGTLTKLEKPADIAKAVLEIVWELRGQIFAATEDDDVRSLLSEVEERYTK